jgi:uncharacterized protein YndB with AHSA1/START domain
MPVTEQPTDKDTLVVSAEFPQQTPATVFDYWIKPDLLTQWWPPEANIEPVVGGEYRLQWPSYNSTLQGKITTLKAPEEFGFTWWWDHYPPEKIAREVLVQFSATDNGTLLTITHGPYLSTEEDQEERQGFLEAWDMFISRLQNLLQQKQQQ